MKPARRLPVSIALALAGCAPSKSLYYWGEYEDLIYDLYAHPGKADPATQVARLREDVGRARAAGLRVPSGGHAHLGYIHSLLGDPEAAASEFEIEKVLFPESATLMDRLIRQIRKP